MLKPVSSVYGEIRKLLLTYPSHNLDDEILQRYLGIFSALGNDVEYVVLAHRQSHGHIARTAQNAGLDPDANLTLVSALEIEKWDVAQYVQPAQNGLHFVLAYPTSWHSIWAQDGYCVLTDDTQQTRFLEPLDFDRGGDDDVAEQISIATGIGIEHTKYHIQGGNILAGDDYLLIGKDYLQRNMQLHGETAEQVSAGFRHRFGVSEVIWLGLDSPVRYTRTDFDCFQGTWQPIFHIDMYVTLAGKAADGSELVFVADLREGYDIIDGDINENPWLPLIADDLDRTAEQLATHRGSTRFTVKRLPIDIWLHQQKTGAFLTYNNCLIETMAGQKNVYIPAYASVSPGSSNRRELDRQVAARFTEYGFNAVLMDGAYEKLCKRGGSIHCITKVIERDLSSVAETEENDPPARRRPGRRRSRR